MEETDLNIVICVLTTLSATSLPCCEAQEAAYKRGEFPHRGPQVSPAHSAPSGKSVNFSYHNDFVEFLCPSVPCFTSFSGPRPRLTLAPTENITIQSGLLPCGYNRGVLLLSTAVDHPPFITCLSVNQSLPF